MMKKNKISRRQLIKNATFAAIAGALYWNTPFRSFAKSTSTTKVVLIRDKDLLNAEGKINESILEKMLDKALLELTGAGSSSEAWKRIVSPEDIVALYRK